MVRQTMRFYLAMTSFWELGLAFHAATYVTFLMRHGLDLYEVNLVNVAFFLTVALCELPTGTFADVCGRKASYAISCFLIAIGLTIYGASGTFAGFVAAEVVIAIGLTFASGAFQAWVVDQLKHHGHTEPLDELFAREGFLAKGMSIGGALLGAFLFTIAMPLPWFLGAAVYAVMGVVVLMTMREDYFHPRAWSWADHRAEFSRTIRVGAATAARSSSVRLVIGVACAWAFATQAPNMQWQPFFGPLFGDQTGLGLVWAGIGLFSMAGAALVPRWRRFFAGDARNALAWTQAVAGAGIALTPFLGAPSLAALWCYLAHEVFRGMYRPLKDAYLNEKIVSSGERATILSFQSMWVYGAGALGLWASGYLARETSISAAWVISGLLLAFSVPLLFRRRS